MCSDPNMKTTLRRGEVSAVCYEHTGEPMCLHLRQPAFPSRDPGVLAPPVTAPAPKDTQRGSVPTKKQLAGTRQGRQVSPITS